MNRRGFGRLGWMSLCLVLLGAAAARGDVPPVIDCPWFSPTGGDPFGLEAFYVPSYPGTSLGQVTLYLSFPAAGLFRTTSASPAGIRLQETGRRGPSPRSLRPGATPRWLTWADKGHEACRPPSQIQLVPEEGLEPSWSLRTGGF